MIFLIPNRVKALKANTNNNNRRINDKHFCWDYLVTPSDSMDVVKHP